MRENVQVGRGTYNIIHHYSRVLQRCMCTPVFQITIFFFHPASRTTGLKIFDTKRTQRTNQLQQLWIVLLSNVFYFYSLKFLFFLSHPPHFLYNIIDIIRVRTIRTRYYIHYVPTARVICTRPSSPFRPPRVQILCSTPDGFLYSYLLLYYDVPTIRLLALLKFSTLNGDDQKILAASAANERVQLY